MRKLFVILVAIFLMATSAYAWVETENNGPQQITTCYIVGVGSATSGNVVVLQTTSPTYPGKEVTFTTTNGLPIYGVIAQGENYDSNDLDAGKFIRVQTKGYAPVVCNADSTIAAGNAIGTSLTRGQATLMASTNVTGNTVSFGAVTVSNEAGKRINMWLK